MSNILIKGMEMPKDASLQLSIDSYGQVFIKKGYEMDYSATDAKAIEVATDRDIPMLVPKKDIHVDEFICPNCGEELTIYCRVWQRYCPMCGQRIYEATNE